MAHRATKPSAAERAEADPRAALEPVYARELSARLAAAQVHLVNGDAVALRLEVHRARVASRAMDAALGAEWNDLERAVERFDQVASAFASELTDPALSAVRQARAARAAGRDMGSSAAALEPVIGAAPTALLPTAAMPAPAVQPGPSTPARAQAQPRAAAPDETVRVGVGKLDALLALAGELRVAQIRHTEHLGALRAQLAQVRGERRVWRKRRNDPGFLLERAVEGFKQREAQLAILERAWASDLVQLGALARRVEDEVLGARLLAAALLVPGLERLVRDLSAQLGKRAALEVSGADVEMDRRILEGLRDALMHMIRNALDHGIEDGATRVARGKPETARVALSFRSEGGALSVTLEDDGAGINVAAVRARGLERGLLNGTEDDERVMQVIFEPGFSTAQTVTDTSGRGVGMDVVRENLRAVNGTVDMHSLPGQGTRFTLRVPVQLATTRVLLVRVGAFVMACPTLDVQRTGRVRSDRVHSDRVHAVGGVAALRVDDATVRVAELGALLGIERDEPEPWQPYIVVGAQRNGVQRNGVQSNGAQRNGVERNGAQRDASALYVDELLGEEEVVVKRLGFPLEDQTHLIGAAVLGSGRTVPILSVGALLERLERRGAQPAPVRRARPAAAPLTPRKRVLVVDDSVTTRTLERSILEASGFETRTAMDGLQALEVLRSDSIDLVLSDVEMPHLDGFGLTAQIRADARLAHIPVILVTSLHAPEQRARGADAGADAYIVKGEFDQAALLQTIGRLL